MSPRNLRTSWGGIHTAGIRKEWRINERNVMFDVIHFLCYSKNINATLRQNVLHRPHLKPLKTLQKRGKLSQKKVDLVKWVKTCQRGPTMIDQHPFKWRHFQSDFILLCVRWYLRSTLSYRDLEEIMLERAHLNSFPHCFCNTTSSDPSLIGKDTKKVEPTPSCESNQICPPINLTSSEQR